MPRGSEPAVVEPDDAPEDAASRAGDAEEGRTAGDDAQRALRPWRGRVGDLLGLLRSWSREHYGPAIDAWLGQALGTPQDASNSANADQTADADQDGDVERAVEDFVCAPGSADEGRSILSVFCDPLAGPPDEELDPEDREQARRWERERRRGVLLVQHAATDRLTLWDPLEGAPLTLHLLHKLPASRVETLGRGTVVIATYQPWMARLVAVGEVEYFTDRRAISLFREEAVSSGATWHEAPPPAPRPAPKARRIQP